MNRQAVRAFGQMCGKPVHSCVGGCVGFEGISKVSRLAD